MKYHCINRVSEKNFTAGQFEERAREQALVHPDTMKRYILFKKRFWNSV